ncbi:hypothetical protein SAMN02745121_06441 [Nannocystis exedens]|uniref:Uncharacterized protein n=1 Tax=Nannocystis exedens TaxID=54 RepID=A0A1I2F4Q5_9BACT|nr:hypothetical protein [Nannocystis exedens]PCC73097.1 hypothetical protein NAEX_06183 [Nannocystis exedens]SFF00292.1 hypothetical protein SAMN02745121_06441 [Nannocystis exedens]
MNSLEPRPTGRSALVGWLLPFLCVSAALIAHWALSVPPGPLPPPVVKEAPPKPSPTPAAGGDEDDDKDKDGFEPFTAPRAAGLLVQLHAAYDGVAFKAEPTFDAWSVAHRPLITQIITATRLQAFKGMVPSPSVSTSNVECHTIRCRFTLSSSKQEDLQLLLDALAGLQLDGAPLWHTWKPDDIAEEPAKRANAKPRMRTQVLVSFARDLPKVDQIALKSGAPLKPATITPVKVPGPSASAPTPSPSTSSTANPLGPGGATTGPRPSTAHPTPAQPSSTAQPSSSVPGSTPGAKPPSHSP